MNSYGAGYVFCLCYDTVGGCQVGRLACKQPLPIIPTGSLSEDPTKHVI